MIFKLNTTSGTSVVQTTDTVSGADETQSNISQADQNASTVVSQADQNASTVVSQADSAPVNNSLAWITQFALIGAMVVAFYFILIRPQRKREKETAQMRDKLEVGDIVTTSGGIVGIVVSIKDDSIIIETGNDRSKIRIKKWAIQANETIHESD